MAPVWIVTWNLHLAIKAHVCWMSNDCNISISMSLFPSLSLPLLCPLAISLSGFSARRSMNWELSDINQSGRHSSAGSRILCQFLYCKKMFFSFFFIQLYVFVGLCNLSVASWKCFVLWEFVLLVDDTSKNFNRSFEFIMCAPSVMTCLIVNAWARQEYSQEI